jgi:hypothetical protein
MGCQPVAQPAAPAPAVPVAPSAAPAPAPASAPAPAVSPGPVQPTGPAQSPYETAAEVATHQEGVSAGPTNAQDTMVLKQGDFKSMVHTTHGRAQIVRIPGGALSLNILGFYTDAGPGLTIVLHSGDPATGFQVSTLTSNTGSYSYGLPGSVDLSKYSKVSIYNKKYNVIWGEADLI